MLWLPGAGAAGGMGAGQRSIKRSGSILIDMLSLLDCPTAKPGGAVNGGRSPFILTVDGLAWFCYLSDKLEVVEFTIKSEVYFPIAF